ncbi:MAG: glutathione S-transferase family protein [Alphaproteobacteria bacterium]|nr:glutathione S-transferase family protein [Alphaproteobacteria bacterium]
MGYTLYGNWLSGPSYKAGLMLRLCGLDFAYRSIDLAKGMHKTPEYLKINRYGQVPALAHDGRIVVQSNTILDYVSEQAGRFRGRGEETWRAKEWLAWEADRLAPNVNRTRFFTRFAPTTDAAVQKYFRDAAELALKVLDGQLAGRQWLVGEAASIADIACYAPVAFAAEGNLELANHSNVKAWAERVAGLPGFAPPYELMPKADIG